MQLMFLIKFQLFDILIYLKKSKNKIISYDLPLMQFFFF